MKTSAQEDRLLVISDVHMGNPLLRAGRPFRRLLRYALDNGYSVCINGDGVDILQMSLSRLTRELSDSFGLFRKFPAAGLRIYYIVGNHDIVLEHFLQDWAGIQVLPFLNVHSGPARIRVEHGHTYDQMFLRYPRLYTAVTVIGRWAIALSPGTYHALEGAMQRTVRLGHRLAARVAGREAHAVARGIPGELPIFREAAEEISRRGFDAVVFGHTHRAGRVALSNGATYYNTGFWMVQPYCVAIERGEIWFGPVEALRDRTTHPSRRSANLVTAP